MSVNLKGNRQLTWNWGNLLHDDLAPKVIDLSNGELVCELTPGHTDMIRGGLEAPSGDIVTWSNDQTIRVWDANTGQCKAVLEGHKEYIQSVVLVDENTILSDGADNTYRVWNLSTGKQQALIAPQGMGELVHIIKPDPQLMITWQEKSGLIGVWDLLSGKLKHKMQYDCAWAYPGLIGLSEGLFICSDLQRPAFSVWDATNANKSCEFSERLLDACMYDDELLLAWDRSSNNTVEISLISIHQGCYLKTVDIPASDLGVLRVIDGRIFAAMQDLRLLELNLELEVINSWPLPTMGDAPQIISPYLGELSDKQILDHVAKDHGSTVHYHAPNLEALHSKVGAQGVYGFSNVDLGDESCIATVGVLDESTVLINNCSDELLYWKVGTSQLKPFQQASIQIDRDIEFWWHNYGVPRSLVLSGGYFPNQALTELIPIDHIIDSDERDQRPWCLRNARSQRLRVTTQGDLLFWDLDDPKSIALIKRDGQQLLPKCYLIAPNSDEVFRSVHPIISPTGELYRWHDERLVPFIEPDTAEPIRVAPESRRFCTGHYWDSSDCVLFRNGKSFVAWDARHNREIESVENIFDGNVWGITKGANDCWVIWSRSLLASFSSDGFKPLYRLNDPADWGPGYEEVVPLKNGGVAFFSGLYSMDNRITLWNGIEPPTVVQCHDGELSGVLELGQNRFLSWATEQNPSMMCWAAP